MNLRVGKTRNSRYVFSDCFALPTVLISSIIMLSVLLSTAVMTTSTRVALKNQLNNRLSKLAGEAGEAYAEACLDRNNGISSWTETKPLKPDTDCNGTQLSGINCPGNHDLCSLSSNNGGKSKSIFSIGLKDTPPPKQWKMISTGDDHNCSISSGDKIFCWGGNHSGQLGDGTTIGRHVPIEVKFDEAHVDEDVVLVSAGGSHTCAITAEIINNLYCWGNNSNGQLGTNSQTESHTPVAISSFGLLNNKKIMAVSTGEDHTCAITNEPINNLYCWGYNYHGQIGNGLYGNSANIIASPTRVTGSLDGKSVIYVSAGSTNTCVLVNEPLGNLYCWGYNWDGQVGDGTSSNTKPSPTQVVGVLSSKKINNVSNGYRHTCAITNDLTDNLYCWGSNGIGQVGDGTSNNKKPYPTRVTGNLIGMKVSYISAGGGYDDGNYSHTCAITNEIENNIYCWGYNGSGELGDGTYVDRFSPRSVIGEVSGKTLIMVETGWSHGCVLSNELSNNIYCWGYNRRGELGDGLSSESKLSKKVNLTNVYVNNLFAVGMIIQTRSDDSIWRQGTQVSRQNSFDRILNYQINSNSIEVSGYSTCLINTANKLYCWGDNGSYQLGDGTRTNRKTPWAVGGVLENKTIISVSGSRSHTCAISNDGNNNLYCWGSNGAGSIGDGTTTDRVLPTHPTGLLADKNISAISANSMHSCAITNEPTDNLYCWGYNIYGQIGDGTTISPKTSPVRVGGLLTNKKISHISTGDRNTCAITDDSKDNLYCWGDNFVGQIGDGTYGSSNTRYNPTPVTGYLIGKKIMSVSVGQSFSCAFTNDLIDNLYCWGGNSYGNIGDGTTISPRTNPTAVGGILIGKRINAISAGAHSTCALSDESLNNLYCWGGNMYGQVGNGNTSWPVSAPTNITGILANKKVSSISGGSDSYSNHNCAVSEGKGYCWGSNNSGQLGNNSYSDSDTPVLVFRAVTSTRNAHY